MAPDAVGLGDRALYQETPREANEEHGPTHKVSIIRFLSSDAECPQVNERALEQHKKVDLLKGGGQYLTSL